LAKLREYRPLGELLLGRFGHAKVDDLGHGPVVVLGHQHVGGLDVAVDDPLLVGVLNGMADWHEQLQPLPGSEVMLVAILGNGDALDQLHDEVGLPGVRRPGLEHLGDVGVVHHRQGLFFRLEPGDDLPAVHAGLDDLQGHPPADRLGLLGHVHHAHPACADLLQKLVGADHRPRPFGDRRVKGWAKACELIRSQTQVLTREVFVAFRGPV